jgi:hypothetical protein
MSMPGEYHVARFAGWSDPWAYGMPFSLSAYAGIAAVVAATRPKGARGRFSATVGAAFAIVLALAAQVVAHLVNTGHMDHNQAWLIAVTSMVPPAVLAHLLHLAATPVPAAEPEAQPVPAAVTVERAEAAPVPPRPVEPPAVEQLEFAPELEAPAAEEQRPERPTIQYSDPRCVVIRALYEDGYRPTTTEMRAALAAAGHTAPSPSGIRGGLRAEVERHEPHLAELPARPTPLHRAG